MFKPQDPDQFGTTVSRIWTFVFFTMIFRDLHEMSTARTIEGILDGRFEGNPVTDAGLAIGGVLLVLLLLTSLFSNLLEPLAVRRMNLIASPVALAGSLYLFPNDPDDYILGGVTAVALLTIFVLCWKWRPATTSDSPGEVRHAA